MGIPLTSELIPSFRIETGANVEDYESIRRHESNLLSFCEWISEKLTGRLSFIHFVFSIMWLKGMVQNIVTTNWDLLLEYQIERIYDSAYNKKQPFGEIGLVTSVYRRLPGWSRSIAGQLRIDAGQLFFESRLDHNSLFWQPRYEVVYDDRDLSTTSKNSKALYKLHGSPFFLLCRECEPYERWRPFSREAYDKRCPKHPSRKLIPQITLPQEQIDKPHPGAWNRVKNILSNSKVVIVVGYSGRDLYAKDLIEGLETVHVFNKSLGNWNERRICFHKSLTEDLVMEMASFLN